MTLAGWIQIALFWLALVMCVRPLGNYIYSALETNSFSQQRWLNALERVLCKICGVDPEKDMTWVEYANSVISFSLVGVVFSYALLRLQGMLPLNPMHFSAADQPSYATAMTADLAFNTAVSFSTNTNWQAYSGESTLSYLSQMLGLAFHNWVSAAVGLAVAFALARGFARSSTTGIGNFWRDLMRGTLLVLLPISFVFALLLIGQGVIQNFDTYTAAKTLEGATQIIPQGPVASQEVIKLLGTNGGGFFNANSGHPYENPTPFCNFLEMFLIFVIPAALTNSFGRMVKDERQGWALFATMLILSLAGISLCYFFEAQGNPLFSSFGIDMGQSLGDLGGNMEGKEIRFGLANSALFAAVTTDASCGAINCAHDSLTPLGGLIPLLNIQLGEIVFGGVGAGLYGMLIYAVLTVFISGLMVGRTPEYLGKKIEKKEVKMSMLFVLIAALSILGFSAAASAVNLPQGSYFNSAGPPALNVNNNGAHGFSELLYAFSSATGNNGSAFAGLSANTPFYNITTAIAMLVGRFMMIVPVLALAGSLAQKKTVPPTAGTFPTHGVLFVTLLISVILIVGALTFFPALTLGPIVEQFLLLAGRKF